MSATPTRDGFTLPRSSRLRRTSDYRRVQGRGRKVRRRSLLVLWLPRRDHPIPRVGLTVSKKVGNAVVRNQVKRWLREAVRHELHRLVRPVDVVLIAHPNSATQCGSLRDEVRSAFREVMERPPRRSLVTAHVDRTHPGSQTARDTRRSFHLDHPRIPEAHLAIHPSGVPLPPLLQSLCGRSATGPRHRPRQLAERKPYRSLQPILPWWVRPRTARSVSARVLQYSRRNRCIRRRLR